jgi:glutathione S-transferase
MNPDTAVFYEFVGSAWANAPKITISEVGLKPGDVEVRSVDLANGANFDPNGYLKVSDRATVPALVIGDHKYLDSTDVVRELIKLGPDAPKEDSHTRAELEKIIRGVHSPQHDPNTLFLLPVDDADLEAKKNGGPGGFIAGRQKALDQ